MVYGRESNESLKEQIDCADRNALSLAGVMAASAADVDAFGAVELDDSVLTDGGIADSQGWRRYWTISNCPRRNRTS